MNEARDIVAVPDAVEEPIDDEAALEAALDELARGFVRLREEGR